MFTSKFRHSVVGLGLLVAAGLAVAGVSGFTSGKLPTASGDLGEIVVTAPHDLGEVIVRAPQDLGEVVVFAQRAPFDAPFLAEVLVTARSDAAAGDEMASVAMVR